MNPPLFSLILNRSSLAIWIISVTKDWIVNEGVVESSHRSLRLAGRMLSVLLLLYVAVAPVHSSSTERLPLTIAHRGASGYAPEHTLVAYRLAIDLGADFVEQDLQVTKDGVLVCLHDAELSRTTNAKELFPDRAVLRNPGGDGKAIRGWYVVDFTLAEIKRLDAGSWFNRENPFAAKDGYTGQAVPTLQEAIDTIKGRAGLYIELKSVEFYNALGFDMAKELAAILDKNGFSDSSRRNSIFVQSFYRSGLLRMRQVAPHYARIQLLPMEGAGQSVESGGISRQQASEIARYARGVGPSKRMVEETAGVELFHSAGLLVHPYTFRGSSSPTRRVPPDRIEPNGRSFRENCIAEMRRFAGLGIDGAFSDYPDLWKQAIQQR